MPPIDTEKYKLRDQANAAYLIADAMREACELFSYASIVVRDRMESTQKAHKYLRRARKLMELNFPRRPVSKRSQ